MATIEYPIYSSPPKANELLNRNTQQMEDTQWWPVRAGTAGGTAIIRNYIGETEYITVPQYNQLIVVDSLTVLGAIVVEEGGLVAIL